MLANALSRLPSVLRCVAALTLLIAGQSATQSRAATAQQPSTGQWFVALISTQNQRLFCIPATARVVDIAQAVAQYRQSHATTVQLTPPEATQILARLYPCQASSAASAAAPPPSATASTEAAKTDDSAAPLGIATIELMRTLQNTSGHENDGVLETIKSHADAHPPPVLFGLARVLFRQGDVDGAIFWFNAARLRGNFDAWRAADVVSARATMVALSRQMPIELRKAQFADPAKLRGIVAKVIAWDETTARNYDRRWIDFHGVAADKNATGGGKPVAATIPPEKWDELARQVRDEYRKDLEISIAMLANAKK